MSVFLPTRIELKDANSNTLTLDRLKMNGGEIITLLNRAESSTSYGE